MVCTYNGTLSKNQKQINDTHTNTDTFLKQAVQMRPGTKEYIDPIYMKFLTRQNKSIVLEI